VTRSVLTHRVEVGICARRVRTRSNRNPNPTAHTMQLPGAVIQNRTRADGIKFLNQIQTCKQPILDFSSPVGCKFGTRDSGVQAD
jgi:hypothetical protein